MTRSLARAAAHRARRRVHARIIAPALAAARARQEAERRGRTIRWDAITRFLAGEWEAAPHLLRGRA